MIFRIAIDGPAASGKTTVGAALAARLGVLFFDTGIMYRVATLAALNELGSVRDEAAVTALSERIRIDIVDPSVADGRKCDVLLDGLDVTWEIRSQRVDANVSPVSAYAGVRKAMTSQQRAIGLKGSIVMVGRDIGTVVLPEADLKIYLEASAEERARRRYQENTSRGVPSDYQEILASVKNRDSIDSSRAVAPLKPAVDAVIIDTDLLPAEAVIAKIYALAQAKIG